MNSWTKDYYIAQLKRTILIPEPPRKGILRHYNTKATFFNKFTTNIECQWKSAADILDLTRNYWEKIPTQETWFYGDGCFYLLPNDHELYWLYDRCFTNCGPKYLEDQYDDERVARARKIVNLRAQELEDKLLLSLAGVELCP
jgi:hypothetical protein